MTTTTKIRLEAEAVDDIQRTIDALRGAGFNVTGETRAYINRRDDGYRVYAVLTVDPDPTVEDRRKQVDDARRKALEAHAAGNVSLAGYWNGYADALEN